jgi:hypothetical protein
MRKILIILFALLTLGIFVTSCVTVQPWERGNLSKPIMIFDKDPIKKGILLHYIEFKEGSSGATGSQSGGCGCG